MKWRLLGILMDLASALKREPEHSELIALGAEIASLDAVQPAANSR
ncbi:MAG: hypothetical protein L3K17_07130 [Thermoplasmata archaeon]|nr:hypothetical protein [Thermoplasmata archaeon]